MDPAVVSGLVVTLLRPFLKGLVERASEIGEQAGKEAGKTALDLAKAVWTRLSPKLESRPAAKEAAEDVAKAPDDEDAAAFLRVQIRKLLEEDEDLGRDLDRMIKEGQRNGPIGDNYVGSQTATSGGVNVGRDAGDISTH